jgi:hypothetical protein
LEQTWTIAAWLQPFLPDTCTGIVNRLFSGAVVKPSPLFPKL